MAELAEHLNMTMAELTRGRGAQMSAHELTVLWPLYHDYKRRKAEDEARRRDG